MKYIEAPVLLIAFNRPENAKKVFDTIKKAKVKKLYFAVDGPRADNMVDELKIEQTKRIINQVDWECEIYKRFANTNQGCAYGVTHAISWAFANEDRLIILEDDCVPANPFFNFCNELLEKYKNDTRIGLISGSLFNEEVVDKKFSYFFSRYVHIWGWATWKRVWVEYDISMKSYPDLLQQNLFQSLYNSKTEAMFFKKIFDGIYYEKNERPHTWDYQFSYSMAVNNHLSIYPTKNLINNIGYDGAHTKTKNVFQNRLIDEVFKLTTHPSFILADKRYDEYHFKKHWLSRNRLLPRVIRKLKKILRYGA